MEEVTAAAYEATAVPSSDDRLEERHRTHSHHPICASSTTRSIGPINATVTVNRRPRTRGPPLSLIKKYYGVLSAFSGSHSHDVHGGTGRRAGKTGASPSSARENSETVIIAQQSSEWPRRRSTRARYARCHFEFGARNARLYRALVDQGAGVERRRRHRSASRPVAAHDVRGSRAGPPPHAPGREGPCWRRSPRIKADGVTEAESGAR